MKNYNAAYNCPMEVTLELIGGKYKTLILPSPDKGIHAFSAGICAFSSFSALDVPTGTPAGRRLETAPNYVLKKSQS